MREIGFNFKCHQGYNRYQIKLEKLKEFGENRKWFSSADIDEVAVELTKKKTTYFEGDDDTHKSNNVNKNEKMEARIRMLEDFVTMQDSFNTRQRARYSMDLKFNEAMIEYEKRNKLLKKEVENINIRVVDLESKAATKKESVSVNDFCDEFDQDITVEACKTKNVVLSKEEKKKLRENEAKNITVKEDVETCRKKLTHLLVL